MKRNRSSIAWVLVPLDATARSSVIEGITTTDSSSWLSRIASQTWSIRSWSRSKRWYRSSSFSRDSRSGPTAGGVQTSPLMTRSSRCRCP